MAPRTPNLNLDALSQKPTETTWLIQQQEMLDKKVDLFNRSCGGDAEGWCQHVVADEQLENYPACTLLIARVCRMFLIFFVAMCCFGLISGWLLEGSMSLAEEIVTMDKMDLPNIAICPQPWGAEFAGKRLTVEYAEMFEMPEGSNKKLGQAAYREEKCPRVPGSEDRLEKCMCYNLRDNHVKPHGKRGELTFFDYIRMSFSGENDSLNDEWAFGFYSNPEWEPQQWSYVTEGYILHGDVKMEQVATGGPSGSVVDRFIFRVTGESRSEDGTTILVFGYDKYLSYVITSFENKFTLFAMMSVLIAFCAAINNFGLFEIAFPEKSESAHLEPNLCFQYACCCCICCQPRRVPNTFRDSHA